MSMQGFESHIPVLQSLWQALQDNFVEEQKNLEADDTPPAVTEGSLSGLGNHRIDRTHLPSAWV